MDRPDIPSTEGLASSASGNGHSEVDSSRTDKDGNLLEKLCCGSAVNSDEDLSRAVDASNNNDFPEVTPRDKDYYDLSPREGKKIALVFNHKTFDPVIRPELKDRDGTENDVKEIKEVFKKQLGFEVSVHNDKPVSEIRRIMAEISNLGEISCLVIFILTHGDDGRPYAYDCDYSIENVILDQLMPTSAINLLGKPKIVFLASCQGKMTDSGHWVRSRNSSGNVDPKSTQVDAIPIPPKKPAEIFCIPNQCDILIYQASYPGHFSFRNTVHGTWLIQTLCQTLKESGENDEIYDVLVKTSRRVAFDRSSSKVIIEGQEYEKLKQLPVLKSTLVRYVYLKRDWSKFDHAQIPDIIQ